MEIGNNKENLVLKTAGKLQIQWGNKFIDLLDRNGNLNVKHQKILQSVESEDDITKDGIYILEDKIIIFYNEEVFLTLQKSDEDSSETKVDYQEEIDSLKKNIEELRELIESLQNQEQTFEEDSSSSEE